MAKTTNATIQTQSRESVIGAIQHTELICQDPAKARKFLEKNFEWDFETVQMPNGDYHVLRTSDGTGLGLTSPQRGQNVVAVPYVNVENCDTALKNAQKGGAEILVPTQVVPGQGRYFHFRVPGGPVLGCWETDETIDNE